nr:hypothetical protein Q903MT_gene5049 [Picea sitchensis]
MSPTYMSRVRLNWPGPSSTLSPVCRFRVVRRIGGIVVRFLGSFGGTPQLPMIFDLFLFPGLLVSSFLLRSPLPHSNT